ncbi:MAG: NAD-dependent epimerase/dehydratase family protein [Nitrosopumilus sp.]|uniref:NAD-dependent epimerase/dehydratase family protein n=1 Tax=Nitrosopumilus sp. TaxID=2024843 RepID=UPI00247B7544|nr:NAD-dependent epimerase/dehydratase family protein [Nitrosopumilus sp.]MCV0393604.1 NAD-dependent epimerase/dehydratase family protein [Nitrosopumilus sp.]
MVKLNQVVITGATGFIGKNLRKYLSKNNVKLISISRRDFKPLKNEIKIISKNFDEKNIISKIQNSDALIHLIGIGKQSVEIDYNSINVELTKKIVNLCENAKIKKIVYLSGLGVSSNTSLGYFISKYKAERSIINSGLNFTIFRPSYIIGKDDYLTKLLKKQIKNNQLQIPGPGNYLIQPIYIDDVVKVIFESIMRIEFQNKILDLVGPETVTFEQYVKLFSKKTKTSIQKINLEDSYYNAINKIKSDYGVDDLNILIGNFKGNHQKLTKISQIKFQSVLELLESGRLF